MDTDTNSDVGLFKILGTLAFGTYVVNTLGNSGITLVLFAVVLLAVAKFGKVYLNK